MGNIYIKRMTIVFSSFGTKTCPERRAGYHTNIPPTAGIELGVAVGLGTFPLARGVVLAGSGLPSSSSKSSPCDSKVAGGHG